MELAPGDAMCHFNLGLTLRHLGRFSEAEEEYKKSIALQPDDAEVHNCLAIVYILTGRIRDARYELEQALYIDPQNRNARVNLAKLSPP